MWHYVIHSWSKSYLVRHFCKIQNFDLRDLYKLHFQMDSRFQIFYEYWIARYNSLQCHCHILSHDIVAFAFGLSYWFHHLIKVILLFYLVFFKHQELWNTKRYTIPINFNFLLLKSKVLDPEGPNVTCWWGWLIIVVRSPWDSYVILPKCP